MVLVANVNKIVALSDKEIAVLNSMTPKDKLYIVTDASAMIPISLFNVLAGLKTKPETVSLPVGADIHAEAFLYGVIAAGVKPTEEVKILADTEITFPSMQNIKWVTSLTGGGKAAGRKPKAEKTAEEVAEKAEPVKRQRKTKITAEKGLLTKKLLEYPTLKSVEQVIAEKEEDIAICLRESSDADIGFKFLLETRIGKKDGETIWTAIHKDYEKLKNL